MSETIKKNSNVELKQTGVKVRLLGEDGNAFAIIGKVCGALRRAGYGGDFIKAYTDEAMSGDYCHLLNTTMEIVEVE